MTSLLAITIQSLKEALRSRILYNVLFLSFVLTVITYVVTEFSYGNPSRISLDIGLGVMSFALSFISILMGSTLIIDEVESRTLYMVLSRPVSRTTFLLGKFFGLSLMVLFNIFLQYIVVLALFLRFGGEVSIQHLWVFLFIYLEAIMLLAATLFFSCFTNKVIAILMGLTLWSCGHGIDILRDFSVVKAKPALLKFVEIYSTFMPNFGKINLKLFVLNDNFVSNERILYLLFYCLLWLCIFLLLSKVVFDKKELS